MRRSKALAVIMTGLLILSMIAASGTVIAQEEDAEDGDEGDEDPAEMSTIVIPHIEIPTYDENIHRWVCQTVGPISSPSGETLVVSNGEGETMTVTGPFFCEQFGDSDEPLINPPEPEPVDPIPGDTDVPDSDEVPPPDVDDLNPDTDPSIEPPEDTDDDEWSCEEDPACDPQPSGA